MAWQRLDKTWSLTDQEYQEVRDRLHWLSCLKSAGVDNWSGIDLAIEMYNEEDED